MEYINAIFLLVVTGLAVWKLYDLFFYKDKLINYKRELKKANTQTSIFAQSNNVLTRFFAEFTHKTMKGLDHYEDAPTDIYTWLQINFHEWLDQGRLKKK